MSLLDRLIFNLRFVLVIFATGLLIALFPYAASFIMELYEYCIHCNRMTPEEKTLGILGLADTMMVANIIYLLGTGSFSTFVKKLRIPEEKRPQWLDKINPGSLKVKMAMSIIGIISIHLLRTFMLADKMTVQTIIVQSIVTILVLLICLVLVKTDNMLYGHNIESSKKEEKSNKN